MSCASPSGCACPTPVTTEVPGSPGAAGTNGTNGVNAFSIVQLNFTVPPINSSVSITVNTNLWMTVGQNVFCAGAGYFSVSSTSGTTSVTLLYLNYSVNANSGNVINAGAQISPGGTQAAISVPVTIANGGTGATTQGGAQVALGLGQNATFINVAGLSQAITAVSTLIAGATLTIPTTGLYLVQGFATVEFDAVTFSAQRTLTLKIVDTTATQTIATANKTMQVVTTTSFPDVDYITPPQTATLTGGDVLQLQISVSTINSAGTFQVLAGGIIITPLAL